MSLYILQGPPGAGDLSQCRHIVRTGKSASASPATTPWFPQSGSDDQVNTAVVITESVTGNRLCKKTSCKAGQCGSVVECLLNEWVSADCLGLYPTRHKQERMQARELPWF